jgi:hypothetical protein
MDQQQKQSILEEIDAASKQYPYEAVDVLWVTLIKMANSFPGSNEHRRMLALVESMPSEAVWQVLRLPAVDELLHLDPPLETVLANAHERLEPQATQKAIEAIRLTRHNDPILLAFCRGAITCL